MAEWTYTGESYLGWEMLPAGWPSDIFWDGTYWWVLDLHNLRTYKYDSNWNYLGESYYIGGELWPEGSDWQEEPWSIHYDGTNWWMLGGRYLDLYKYDSNWNLLEVFDADTIFSVGTGGHVFAVPYDIFFDGTYWWLLGRFKLPDRPYYVFKYDSNWNYLGDPYGDINIPWTTNRIYVSSEDTEPVSIAYDGTNWWMAGKATKRIYKYDSNWKYTGINYYVGNESTPSKIHYDGTNWWMFELGYGYVYKYTGPPPPEGFLEIIGITAPTSAHKGDTINFKVHTKNTDSTDNFRIEAFYSTIIFDVNIGSQEFSLGAGLTKDVTFSLTMLNQDIIVTINTYHYEEAAGLVLDSSSVWGINKNHTLKNKNL